MLDLGGEFSFNRKTYKSFAIYIKECLEHREYDYSEWVPSQPTEFLNSGIFFFYTANIKDSIPVSFTRKINCVVPVANSGVPFIPKQAKSE